jgi:hypothetical protein
MKNFVAIAIVVAGAGLAFYSVSSLPEKQSTTPTATELATRLAQSVDPFLLQSGG